MLSNPTKSAPASLPIDEVPAPLAHELCDPLNTVLLALELHCGAGDPAARQAFTMAAHQARRAVRIIDDLFDLCAGSRGKLSLRKEVVELAAVVTTATDVTAHLLAARAPADGLAFDRTSVPGRRPVPAGARADEPAGQRG